MEVALGYFEDDDDSTEFDVNKPAASGIEYLKRVQYEASQHPEVVIVPYPSNKTDINENSTRQNPIREVVSHDSLLIPNEKAQLKSAADFAYLRQTFIRFKSKHKNKTTNSVKIPKSIDIDIWCKFCFGCNFLKADMNNDTDSGIPPLLGVLSQISQPLAIQLLDYHLLWFNRKGFCMNQGRWLFALLLCIDKPTPPDALSSLRNISRKFIQFRVKAALDEDKEILYQLYFFIIIVSRYFGQADLALNS